MSYMVELHCDKHGPNCLVVVPRITTTASTAEQLRLAHFELIGQATKAGWVKRFNFGWICPKCKNINT